MQRPKKTAPIATWREYAASLHVDTRGMNKQEIQAATASDDTRVGKDADAIRTPDTPAGKGAEIFRTPDVTAQETKVGYASTTPVNPDSPIGFDITAITPGYTTSVEQRLHAHLCRDLSRIIDPTVYDIGGIADELIEGATASAWHVNFDIYRR
ncbi:hypothetical protein [Corynebacterium antarcticum]|uniref:hypothetical protein n=1 Tax=Corynebacterium antarcticum TaxID=2800405 RepID=UPI0020052434|nr:hypothetical protein [Corynebacterium antarcticum]MCK7661292.1 hypothetical protein [Corynebacterium antarcticum]